MPRPNSALSSKSELDHANTASIVIRAAVAWWAGCRRRSKSIRGVGDDRAVSEELGKQLDVRSFTASGTCAGELKERLEELHVLHLRERKLLARNLGQGEEEVPVAGFALAKLRLRDHVDGPVLGSLLDFAGQASMQRAPTGAIFRSDLQRVLVGCEVLPLGLGGLEGLRRGGEQVTG